MSNLKRAGELDNGVIVFLDDKNRVTTYLQHLNDVRDGPTSNS